MFKVYRALLAALIALIVLLGMSALAEDGEVLMSGYCGAAEDNLIWVVDEDGILTITGDGDMADYADLSEQPWSDYSMSIRTVTLEPGVTGVGSHAFSGMQGLESVALPEGLESIGANAFSDGFTLSEVVVPAGTKTIGDNAFARCYNMTSVTLPASLTGMGSGVFDECYSIVVKVVKDSYAHKWCNEQGIVCEAEGTVQPQSDFTTTVSGGKATITGYSGTDADVIVPAQIDGVNVVAIGPTAFAGNTYMQTLSIAEGVETIGDRAFGGCSGLVSAVLPDSLTDIADTAFENCHNLTAKVSDGSYAHDWCVKNGVDCDAEGAVQVLFTYIQENGAITVTGYSGGDTEVAVPEKIEGLYVKVIGANAFADDYNIRAVTLPEGVETIGSGAFARCYNLNEINLPAGVASIGTDAFKDCFNLTVKVADGSYAHKWCAENGVVFEAEGAAKVAFEYTIDNGKVILTAFTGDDIEIIVPGTVEGCPVTAIGARAFAGRYGLESVSLPESIASIGESAFAQCYNLTSINLPAGIASIGAKAFDECFNLTASVTAGSYAHKWCNENGVSCKAEGAAQVVFEYAVDGGKVTVTGYDGDDAEVVIPAAVEGYPVTAIAAEAFADCHSLSAVTLPASIAAIGENAFARCYNLRTINLPESITSIGANAFADCYNVTAAVESGSYAHQWCVQNGVSCESGAAEATDVEYTMSNGAVTVTGYSGDETEIVIAAEIGGYPVKAIADGAFSDDYMMRSVSLPEWIETIGKGAFARCYNLNTINLPESITSIGDGAFAECINLSAKVKTDSYAHTWCRNNGIVFEAEGTGEDEPGEVLKTCVLPESLTTIGESAFVNIAAEMVILPDGCVTIGSSAFANNLNLRKVYMPDSVTDIADSAFAGCEGLIFICESENAAAAYAYEKGIRYEIGTY